MEPLQTCFQMSGIGPHPYQVSGLSVSSLISCSGARMGLAGEAGRESEGDEQQRSALICMRLGSARPSNPRQLMLAKDGQSFLRTAETTEIPPSELRRRAVPSRSARDGCQPDRTQPEPLSHQRSA